MEFAKGKVKMKLVRLAESSNSGAMELLSLYALDDSGNPMPPEKAMEIFDEMDMEEFYPIWISFLASRIRSATH